MTSALPRLQLSTPQVAPWWCAPGYRARRAKPVEPQEAVDHAVILGAAPGLIRRPGSGHKQTVARNLTVRDDLEQLPVISVDIEWSELPHLITGGERRCGER